MKKTLLLALAVPNLAFANLLGGVPNTLLTSLPTTVIQAETAVLPTCDDPAVGTEIMYLKGTGATETISKCICEQLAGPVYAWGAATSTGDCT